jgi:3-oxoadipate enol-lactonase
MSIKSHQSFADLETHQIFYKIAGKGERLLLISGTNSDTRHAPTIYDVPGANGFELMNYDHRGMGQSSSPDEVPTMETYADDIAKLLDHAKWEKTSVIGISFGGMVAQHFALRHPDRVNRLALCCTSSGGKGGVSYPLQTLSHLNAEEYARFIMTKMNITHDLEWQEAHPKKAKAIFEFYFKGANANYSDPVKYAAVQKQFAARAKHDVFDALHHLYIPTIIACGKDDGVAPPENSENLADAIPGAELSIFNGGHMFLKENPKAWPTLFDFFNGN